jgi:hypothetical protein
MQDMKMTEIEKKDFCTPTNEAPKYPYGLRITINKEQYDKFAFQSTPKLEDEFQMIAKVQVVSTDKDDDGNPSFQLQIMELDLKSKREEELSDSASQVIYGES